MISCTQCWLWVCVCVFPPVIGSNPLSTIDFFLLMCCYFFFVLASFVCVCFVGHSFFLFLIIFLSAGAILSSHSWICLSICVCMRACVGGGWLVVDLLDSLVTTIPGRLSSSSPVDGHLSLCCCEPFPSINTTTISAPAPCPPPLCLSFFWFFFCPKMFVLCWSTMFRYWMRSLFTVHTRPFPGAHFFGALVLLAAFLWVHVPFHVWLRLLNGKVFSSLLKWLKPKPTLTCQFAYLRGLRFVSFRLSFRFFLFSFPFSLPARVRPDAGFESFVFYRIVNKFLSFLGTFGL